MKNPMRRVASAALLTLLAACAMPLQPDLAARAPELPGYGQLRWPISTASPAAQKLFVQGVLQAYAFNEVEAVRMFKAALAQDPACAMCAWGVAWQLGPNINNHSRSAQAEALTYVGHALRHAAGATPREKALIEAMALRYGHASQARDTAPLLAERCGPAGGNGGNGGSSDSDDQDDQDDDDDGPPSPLNAAYAERLRKLVDAAPGDADLLSLYAEAEMIATRVDWWNDKTGQPGGRIGELTALLEQALTTQPEHTGLNHYLVHAADSAPAAQRAVAAADRLGRLAPASAHLVHMPSHIYVRVGRYADATAVNEAAVTADLAFADQLKAQNFSASKDWHGHNQSFLWFAALMQGRGDVALATARNLASRAKDDHTHAEYRRSMPILALLRTERWDALLTEPLLSGNKGMAQALGESARGVAHARSAALPEAKAALVRAAAGAQTVAKTHSKPKGFDRLLRDMSGSAVDRLRAEIASAEGRHDDALALQAKAVIAARRADSNEPPMLAAGARLALGDLQLRAGKAAAAEKTFRDDLLAHPGSGWAIAGLERALLAQGRAADAAPVSAQLKTVWSAADAPLLARR